MIPNATDDAIETQSGSFVAGTHLCRFFNRYRGFSYDPTRPSTDEFRRMCKALSWRRGSHEQKEAYEDFNRALVMEFNDMFGSNGEIVETWQGLCVALAIDPLPTSVRKAKAIFRSVFVNLVDVVDCGRSGAAVRRFGSLEQLREYTLSTERIFPREDAYAGGVLRFLLREITGHYRGKKPRMRQPR